MDSFGNRAALLASLERIVAISIIISRGGSGTTQLFDAVTGVTETITLPDVNNVDKREQLNWERELIGLYISDHPLTPLSTHADANRQHFSGQLSEAQHEEKIRVRGWSPRASIHDQDQQSHGLRHHRGYQGNIELVLFPRTWEKYREQLSIGQNYHR